MTAEYHVTYTRPSTNHLFVFELASNSLDYDRIDITMLGLPGLVKINHCESITWNDIKQQYSELRPDLQDKFFNRDMYIDKLVLSSTEFPYFNPFSLTHSEIYVFNSLEELQVAYTLLFEVLNDQLTDQRLQLTENTISQSVTVDQQKIEVDWLSNFC